MAVAVPRVTVIPWGLANAEAAANVANDAQSNPRNTRALRLVFRFELRLVGAVVFIPSQWLLNYCQFKFTRCFGKVL